MAEEEQSLLNKTGDFLYDSFIWDDEAPTWMNVASTALNIASVATVALTLGAGTPLAAGMQAGRVALVQGAKSVAKRAAIKTATKKTAQTVAKTAVKEVAENTVKNVADKSLRRRVNMMFAATALPYVAIGGAIADNKTGGHAASAIGRAAVSDSWYKPAADLALSGLLSLSRIYNDATSAVPAAGAKMTISALEEKGKLDPNDSKYEVKKQIIKLGAQILSGNIIAVGNVIAGTDIQGADIVDAYRTARKDAPDDAVKQGEIALDLLSDKIKKDKVPTAIGSSFDQARENISDSFKMPSWIKDMPILGWIIGKVVELYNYITNLFDGADKGNLRVQGGQNRLAKMMDKNGHIPAAGANIKLISHDGEDLGNVPLNANKQQTGLNLAPAVQ